VKDFGLVVIGAHFGVWLENEINKFKGHNILLVEPVPYNIEILEKKYSEFNNIYICKNAIFSKKKTSSFYYVNGKSIHKLGKHWASGIGSFDKNHILNHKSKRFKIEDDDIIEMKMNFITFKDIIDIFSVKSINRLQIDVEGAEYEILNSIDFKNTIIDSILFESKHFDGTFKEGDKLLEIKKKLSNEGYTLSQIDSENILAKKNYL
tara:strand:- start:31 stop:651 length:621 start_codon:yes stop_codon:yes gene_type:complete